MIPTPEMMALLVRTAMRSGCQKSKRGVLIVPKTILLPLVPLFWMTGTNRPAVGTCDGSEACRQACSKICVHAEQAALMRVGHHARDAEVYHLKVVDGKPVPSGGPSCVECSKLMLVAGVSGVWLYQDTPRGLGWVRWSAKDFHYDTLAALGLPAMRKDPR